MDVALIQWPSDETLRSELAERGHPRLLLVEPGSEPPICEDPLEDWVRLPVPRVDRNARVRVLEARFAEGDHHIPTIDAVGTLTYRGARTQLSETQTRLISPMIARFGAVVGRDELSAAAWPETDATANSLDVAVGRLRRQLAPVGLRISTVRSRGYLLGNAETP
ncbi:MAG: winged helix-turn-helix domain-containing protein [Acidimicrobiia bacterium]|jgi:hypothetical protein